MDLYQKPASGNGREELLLHGGVNAFVHDWSSDGKWIVYQQTGQTTALDLWLLPTEGDRKPTAYLQTPFSETNPRFAPGLGAPRWMAYQSNESGQNQIYVQAIPATGAKYQISEVASRREGVVLSVNRSKADGCSDHARCKRRGRDAARAVRQPRNDRIRAAADGQRFLLNVPAGGESAAAPPITVVLNWAAGLGK